MIILFHHGVRIYEGVAQHHARISNLSGRQRGYEEPYYIMLSGKAEERHRAGEMVNGTLTHRLTLARLFVQGAPGDAFPGVDGDTLLDVLKKRPSIPDLTAASTRVLQDEG